MAECQWFAVAPHFFWETGEFPSFLSGFPLTSSGNPSTMLSDFSMSYRSLVPHFLWESTLRSEEHTSELQSLMRISYDVFCLKKKRIDTYRSHYHSSYYTT